MAVSRIPTNPSNTSVSSRETSYVGFSSSMKQEFANELATALSSKKKLRDLATSKESFFLDTLKSYIEEQGDVFDMMEYHNKPIKRSFIRDRGISVRELLLRGPTLLSKPFSLSSAHADILQDVLFSSMRSRLEKISPNFASQWDTMLLNVQIPTGKSIFDPNVFVDFKSSIIEFREDAIQDPSTRKAVQNLFNSSITNKDLLDHLHGKGNISEDDKNIIENKDTREWNMGYRKLFEAVTAKGLLDECKDGYVALQEVLSTIKNNFSGIKHNDFLKDITTHDIHEVTPENIQTFLQRASDSSDPYVQRYTRIVSSCIDTTSQPPVVNFSMLTEEQQLELYALVGEKIQTKDAYKLLTQIMGLQEGTPEAEEKKQAIDILMHDIFDLQTKTIKIPSYDGEPGFYELIVDEKTVVNHARKIEDIRDFGSDDIVPLKMIIDLGKGDNLALLQDTGLLEKRQLSIPVQRGQSYQEQKLFDAYKKPILDTSIVEYTAADGAKYTGLMQMKNDKLYIAAQGGDKEISLPIGPKQFKVIEETGKIDVQGDELMSLLLTGMVGISEMTQSEKDWKEYQKYLSQKTYDRIDDAFLQPETERNIDQTVVSDFWKKWDSINGYDFSEVQGYDTHHGLIPGAQIYFNFSDTQDEGLFQTWAPGGGSTWGYIEVKSVDLDTKKFSFTVQMADGLKSSKEHTSNIDIEFFEKIKNIAGGGKMLKMFSMKKDTINNTLKSATFNKDIDSFIKRGVDICTGLTWGKKYPTNASGKEVLYFTKTESKTKENGKDADGMIKFDNTEERIDYKIEVQNDGVLVSLISDNINKLTIPDAFGKMQEKEGKIIYSKKMDFSAFMIFVGEKNLQPRTQEEYDMFVKQNPIPPAKKSKGWKLYTPASILAFVNKMGDGVKKYFEDKAEKNKSDFEWEAYQWMVGSGTFDKLSKLRFVGGAFSDMKDGFVAEWDYAIFKKITEKKEDFDKRGKIDATAITSEILELLEKRNPEKLYDMCGGMIFCMEKGGLYLRSLSKKQGSGLWIKALLGDEHHAKFMQEVKQKEIEAKNNPASDINSDELLWNTVRHEVKFIIDTLDNNKELKQKTFSQQFRVNLETTYNSMFTKDKIADSAKEEESIRSFSTVFGNFRDYMKQNRIQKALGALKALTKLANSPEEVQKVNFAFMFGLSSGAFTYATNVDNKEFIDELARSIGFPLGYYAKEPQGQLYVTKIMNILCKQAGIKPVFSETLEWTSDKYSVDTWANNTWGKDYNGRFLGWWLADNHGKKISELMDPKQLARILDDDKYTPDEKVYIQDFYIKAVEADEFKRFDTEVSNATFYQTNAFNVSNSIVRQQMLKFSFNGSFDARIQDQASKFWESVITKLKDVNEHSEVMSRKEFVFLMNKLFTWFGDKFYNNKNIAPVLKLLYLAKNESDPKKRSEYINYAIERTAESISSMPAKVQDTLQEMQTLLFNNIHKNWFTEKTIEDIFDSRKAKLFSAPTETNFFKDYKTKIDRAIERKGGIFDDDRQNSMMGGYGMNPYEAMQMAA